MANKFLNLNILLALGIFLLSGSFFPFFAKAQEPTYNLLYSFDQTPISAKSYIVLDKESGKVLLEKNSQMLWVPASLTKLVTAMVFLDQNPNFKKIVAMKQSDEVGGARIATKAGVKYYLGDLFFASLVASANNSTNAIARSTGLSLEEFVQKMNEKVRELGAKNTYFVEPTGIDPNNITTAEDYSKIIKQALVYSKIKEAMGKATFSFKSTNNSRYKHNLKNTDLLLSDPGLIMVGGKTGYLDESGYNFAAEIKDVDGKNVIVVLFGSKDHQAQFWETKQITVWSWVNYKWPKPASQVAGASTFSGLKMPGY